MTAVLATLAAIATAVFVGATMVATRYVIDQSDPASLALMRYVIGFLCLLPPFLMGRHWAVRRRDIGVICLLGIGQFGILIALLNFGLQYIGPARAALIFATLPLLTLMLAAAIGQERLTLAKITGVLATIAGLALALGEKAAPAPGVTEPWIGDLAVFGSTICGAVCGVLYRPYLQRYSALGIGAIAMLASVLFLLPMAALENLFDAWPAFTAGGWLAVLFIGVSSGAGYYLWLWALQHTTATRVTLFMALSPLTAAVLGFLLLDETLSHRFIAGLAAVIVGLVIAHWPSGEANKTKGRHSATLR
jgi:drug/metabolite transporter (DMT)-like permease